MFLLKKQLFPLPLIVCLVDDIMDDKYFYFSIPGSKLQYQIFLFFPLLMTEKLLFQQLIHKRNMKFLKMIHQTSNPLLNMKGAQILPYYDPVRRKNITKQFGQNQNKILKFSQNPASKHKPNLPYKEKDLKL